MPRAVASTFKKTTKFQNWIAVVSIVVGLIALISLGWGLVSLYKTLFPHEPNYAEEVAGPLESSLLSGGAKKVCESGDAGRGWDNKEPWYNTYLSFSKSKDVVEKLVYKSAGNNDYSLVRASAQNKSFLQTVSDDQISNYYFATKPSPYPDLSSGNIQLTVAIEDGNINPPCPGVTIRDGDVLVRIGVSLPVFK